MIDHAEAHLSADEIKSRNQEVFADLMDQLLANLDVSRTNTRLHLESQSEPAQIVTAEGAMPIFLEINDNIRLDRLGLDQFIRITIKDKHSNDVAWRSYIFFTPSDASDKLHFESNLWVSIDCDRIGLGSALIDQDETMRELIAKQISVTHPISSIEAEVVDQTAGEDTEWTSRRFRQLPDWKETKKGHFLKTKPFRS